MAGSRQSSAAEAARAFDDGLSVLFNAQSIAVLGASDNARKTGGRPLRFLLDSGFAGQVYPINPHRTEVQGVRAYRDLAEIPGPVDLALIAVPRDDVFDAIRQCTEKGVRFATIFSSGFAEADAEGAALQAGIAQHAKDHGMRLLGPNCIGSRSSRGNVIATFAATEGVPKPDFVGRRVGFVSQSGAIAAHCVLEGFERGVQFDPWISTGNEADIQFADALAALAMDDGVDAIAAYMEGCRDGERLVRALALAQERNKPVIMLKVGRSEVGAQAAASHTAALVGSEAVWDAVFRRYNVCRVDSMAELLDIAHLVAVGPPQTGDRVALVTGSGGVGILMADVAEDVGLVVPPLPAAAQAWLRELVPAAGVANPIDTTAMVMNDPDLLESVLATVFEASEYDGVIAFLTYMGKLRPWADVTVETLRRVRKRFPDKPFAIAMSTLPDIRHEVEQLGIPVFEDVSTLMHAVAKLAAVRRGQQAREVFPASEAALPRPTRTSSNEVEALHVLADSGVPVVAHRVATTAGEAADFAGEVGFPVVLKIVSADVPHKTEAGGVRLRVGSRDAAQAAFVEIMASVLAHVPGARIDGVLVAPMVEGGVEVIMGVKNDPMFGPTVLFGLGGIFVEVLQDVTYRLAPFGVETARSMIEEIRGFALLTGARGSEPADLDALARALSALSKFADRNRDFLDGVDVNPFLVQPVGRGAVALDALITWRA